ncbi:hypothetical protein EES43_26700 [Streptomyces sp. ADI96-02]|nr:hypothetical protein EES43_26700 [Streptomyces sp. ADI96-02]
MRANSPAFTATITAEFRRASVAAASVIFLPSCFVTGLPGGRAGGRGSQRRDDGYRENGYQNPGPRLALPREPERASQNA